MSGNVPNPGSPDAAPVRRAMAYAHYDAEGIVRDYVLQGLRAMRKACPDIRFVTTSRLRPGEAEKLRPLVREVLEVENVGYDFFMWKQAIATIDLGAIDELVLMNSSVYGPFRDIGPLFDEMRPVECDVWGITESLEIERHVQSWFLVFRRTALSSDAFRAFWDSVLPFRNKKQVIRSYELGLTDWFTGSGLRVAASCPWQRVVEHLKAHPAGAEPMPREVRGLSRQRKRARGYLRRLLGTVKVKKVNPTVAFPGELIDMGIPFLKLEVMRDNPFLLDRKAIEDRLRAIGYPLDHLLPRAPGS